MTQEQLSKITHTVSGYPVKNLRWRQTDNIITGLVKDPYPVNPNLHDGFISGQWRSSGTPTNTIKGRDEFNLEMSN